MTDIAFPPIATQSPRGGEVIFYVIPTNQIPSLYRTFGPFEIGSWCLFGICLSAGRQAYWDLVLAICALRPMQEKAGEVVGSAQGFGDSKSLAGLENKPDACWKIDPVTRRDKDGFHPIFCSENNSYRSSILLNELETSF